MSIFNAIIAKDVIVFATDTLSVINRSPDDQNVPFGLGSKIMYFPHLKSIGVTLGSTRLGEDIQAFTDRSNVHSIDELISAVEKDFYSFIHLENYPLDLNPDPLLGLIPLMGYSEVDQTLVAFYIKVFRDDRRVVIEKVDTSNGLITAFHPSIGAENEETIFNQRTNGVLTVPDIEAILVDACKKQVELSKEKETFQVAIGGDVILTTICSLPEFIYYTKVGGRLENHSQLMDDIAQNRLKNIESSPRYNTSVIDNIKKRVLAYETHQTAMDDAIAELLDFTKKTESPLYSMLSHLGEFNRQSLASIKPIIESLTDLQRKQ